MKQAVPKSKNCFGCGPDNSVGLNLTYNFEENKVFTDFIPDKKYGASDSVLHPGISLGILVEAMGWVPACMLKKPTAWVTLEVKALSPITIGKKVRVIAEAIHVNNWLSEVEGVILDDENNICIKAKAKYAILNSVDADRIGHFPEE